MDYDWELIHSFGSGHKYFNDRNQHRIAIADLSGRLPHETDDGVLWCDFDRRPFIDWSNDLVYVGVPVVVENDGSPSQIPCSVVEGVWYARRYQQDLGFWGPEGREYYMFDALRLASEEQAVKAIHEQGLHLHHASRVGGTLDIMEASRHDEN